MASIFLREREDPELELSKIFTELWKLDDNKLQLGKDYQLNLQGVTYSRCRQDQAKDPLFASVDYTALVQRPTYKAFIKLLDNYNASTGVAEQVTPDEEWENKEFIHWCMSTKVMEKAYEYLKSKRKVEGERVVYRPCSGFTTLEPSKTDFEQQLHDIWFKLYPRCDRTRWWSTLEDSSGFEHVFVGETRKRTIGFHNWIQFYLQEKAGSVDYQGYISGTTTQEDLDGPKPLVLTAQFRWKEIVKPIGSLFIGTSPEFELALYTILYLCSTESETRVNIAGKEIVLICHKEHGVLETCYPKVE